MSVVTRLYRGENDIDFPKWWRRALVVLGRAHASSASLSLFTRGLNLGIDFVGGVSWQVKAPGVSVDQARERRSARSARSGTKIQIVGTTRSWSRRPRRPTAKTDQVRDILAKLGHTQPSQVNVSTVGPSWGKDISHKAEQALVVFLLASAALPQPPARVEDGASAPSSP